MSFYCQANAQIQTLKDCIDIATDLEGNEGRLLELGFVKGECNTSSMTPYFSRTKSKSDCAPHFSCQEFDYYYEVKCLIMIFIEKEPYFNLKEGLIRISNQTELEDVYLYKNFVIQFKTDLAETEKNGEKNGILCIFRRYYIIFQPFE